MMIRWFGAGSEGLIPGGQSWVQFNWHLPPSRCSTFNIQENWWKQEPTEWTLVFSSVLVWDNKQNMDEERRQLKGKQRDKTGRVITIKWFNIWTGTLKEVKHIKKMVKGFTEESGWEMATGWKRCWLVGQLRFGEEWKQHLLVDSLQRNWCEGKTSKEWKKLWMGMDYVTHRVEFTHIRFFFSNDIDVQKNYRNSHE